MFQMGITWEVTTWRWQTETWPQQRLRMQSCGRPRCSRPNKNIIRWTKIRYFYFFKWIEHSGVPSKSAARGDDFKFRPFPFKEEISTCAPHIFSSIIDIYQQIHLFNVNFTSLNVNFNVLSEVPPLSQVPPGRLAPSAPSAPSVRHWLNTDLINCRELPCWKNLRHHCLRA